MSDVRIVVEVKLCMVGALAVDDEREIIRIAASLLYKASALTPRTSGERRIEMEEQLSRREIEVLGLVCEGLSNKEIAQKLCIALATVKNHVHNILDKLSVKNRNDAAAWARYRFGE
ncbi:response regulator transcription factor [Streptomyces sp. NPDC051001]|uniref:response regulator transcription factor n=1 Tax=Streptomyces sp. NPDC051001 TaxID=3155795 RepID=UPI003422AD71